MHLSFALLASSLVALVSAQQSSGANPFKIPTAGYLLTAGQPTTFNWTPTTSGTVTLQLRDGANGDLNEGTVIQANIPNSGSYTYTPPSDIVEGNSYTIEIVDDTNPSQVNYTPQFDILSPVKAVPSSASASGASTTVSGSSAASSAAASSTTLATITSTASSATASASTTGTDSSATVATTTVSSSGIASSTVSGSSTRSSGTSTTASSSASASTTATASAATTTSVTSTNGVESVRVGTEMLVVAAIGIAVAVL